MVASTKAYSGALTFGPAVGVERINNRFNVDLGAIKSLYRFDSGVTIGGVAMFGDISFHDIPGEARYEAIVGYTPIVLSSNFSPYIFFPKVLANIIRRSPVFLTTPLLLELNMI